MELLYTGGSVGASFLLVGAIRHYAMASGVLDIPNERSSHTQPTPTGGGIGFVVTIVLLLGVRLATLSAESSLQIAVLLATLGTIAITGWIDDRRSVGVSARLVIHLLCGAAVAVVIGSVAPAHGALNIALLGFWAFWTIAAINVLNFMDGIDGLVASQVLIYSVYITVLSPPQTTARVVGLVLAGSIIGFIPWNWPPAKIFMGDAGSGSLGLLVVSLGALAAEHLPRDTLLFMPLYFLFLDAVTTLGIRIKRGQKLTTPHRAHLYQRMAASGLGHARVMAIYGAVAAVGAAVGVCILYAPTAVCAAGVFLYVAGGGALWLALHRRFPLRRAP